MRLEDDTLAGRASRKGKSSSSSPSAAESEDADPDATGNAMAPLPGWKSRDGRPIELSRSGIRGWRAVGVVVVEGLLRLGPREGEAGWWYNVGEGEWTGEPVAGYEVV